jgi:predicted transcriptional regulator
MPTTTIRVSTETHEKLNQLAEANGISMQNVLDQALEVYRRQQLLEQANAAYAQLRADPVAWAAVEQEREEWDATLGDGLDSEETLS